MAGRTGGGAGDAAQTPAVAGARQFRAFAGAVPAGAVRSRALGLRRGSARGHNDPLPGAG